MRESRHTSNYRRLIPRVILWTVGNYKAASPFVLSSPLSSLGENVSGIGGYRDKRVGLRRVAVVSCQDGLVSTCKRGWNDDVELEFTGPTKPANATVARTPPIVISGSGDKVPD